MTSLRVKSGRASLPSVTMALLDLRAGMGRAHLCPSLCFQTVFRRRNGSPAGAHIPPGIGSQLQKEAALYRASLTLAFVTALFLTFAGEAHPGSVLRYEGSPAIGKFIDIANSVYGRSSFMSNVRTKSKGGEDCVFAGTCDIGGVADELKPAILEKGADATLIGKDAVVIVINSNNPVESITLEQLRGIFAGQIKNWKELGGPDVPVEPVITSPVSATHELFKRIVMGGKEFKAKVIEPDPTILLYVSKNTGAIGFTSFFLMASFTGVKAVKPDGREASVSNPNYPLSRPLYLLTRKNPRTDVREFLDWAVSDEGQSFLKTIFVGIK